MISETAHWSVYLEDTIHVQNNTFYSNCEVT